MAVISFVNDITVEFHLVAMTCSECGVSFGLGSEFIKARRGDQRTFYCPNGHSRWYPPAKRTEADRLREQLEAARSLAKREQQRRELAERQRSAAKGQVTKLKRRAAHGICPCCNRTFVDVARHMAGKHPDFVAEHGASS